MSEQRLDPTLIERGVLAALLDQPEDFGSIVELLEPSDFGEPRHEIIYQCMLDFYQAGRKFDVLLIAAELEEKGELARAGGPAYFIDLTDPDALWATTELTEYVLRVQENSRKRQLSTLGRDIHEKMMGGSGYDSERGLGYAQTKLQEIAARNVKQDVESFSALLGPALEDIAFRSTLDSGAPLGVPTGYLELDRKTGGFTPGQFIIIAGRPAMGKTTIAVDIARAASLINNKTTLFFSLEMSKQELVLKILSAQANILHDSIKKGKVTPDEWERLREMKEQFENSDLLIDDTPNLSMSSLRAKAIKQKARPEGLDMIIIDYLGLMEVGGKSGENRQQQIQDLSRGLKLLGKELGVPVITLAQLNRDSEKRADKTPLPSDLRESGSLEQDADIVLIIHRAEVYDKNDRPGQADLIVGKIRGGETGVVNLVPLLEYSKFANGIGKYAAMEEPDTPTDYGDDVVPEEDPFGAPDTGLPPAAAKLSEPSFSAPAEEESFSTAW